MYYTHSKRRTLHKSTLPLLLTLFLAACSNSSDMGSIDDEIKEEPSRATSASPLIPDTVLANCIASTGLGLEQIEFLTCGDTKKSHGVQNTSGLEHLIALKELHITGEELSSINLTNNKNIKALHVFSDALTAIDFSNNAALTKLSLSTSNLNALSLEKNSELTSLSIRGKNLSSLLVWV